MSLLRPQARAVLWRWREGWIGAAVLALGGWWAIGFLGLLQWVGFAVALIGLALIVTGVQRGRFRNGQDGPGVVQVDERQIAYFGPLTGGVVALGDLSRIAIDRTGHPAHWVLGQPGQPDLLIPLNARGSDQLFDAFASLPGMRTEHMLAQMRSDAADTVVIWQKRTNALH